MSLSRTYIDVDYCVEISRWDFRRTLGSLDLGTMDIRLSFLGSEEDCGMNSLNLLLHHDGWFIISDLRVFGWV